MICGSHSRHTLATTRDSGTLSMYESRLLSWPMYFWYTSCSGALSYGVPITSRYQCDTMFWPSGLMDGHRNNTSVSRMRRVWSSLFLSKTYVNGVVMREPPDSDPSKAPHDAAHSVSPRRHRPAAWTAPLPPGARRCP